MATHSSILAQRIPWTDHGVAKSRNTIDFHFTSLHMVNLGNPRSLSSKESACSAGDMGSIPGLGRSPGRGNGNPLQYPCQENPMDKGDWWATVHRGAKT